MCRVPQRLERVAFAYIGEPFYASVAKIIMKLMRQYYSSDEMVKSLRSDGAVIGQDVKIYAPNKVRIDITVP